MAEEPPEGEAVPVSDQCSNGNAAMFAKKLHPCTAFGTLLEIETQELAQIMVNSESFSCRCIYISSDIFSTVYYFILGAFGEARVLSGSPWGIGPGS